MVDKPLMKWLKLYSCAFHIMHLDQWLFKTHPNAHFRGTSGILYLIHFWVNLTGRSDTIHGLSYSSPTYDTQKTEEKKHHLQVTSFDIDNFGKRKTQKTPDTRPLRHSCERKAEELQYSVLFGPAKWWRIGVCIVCIKLVGVVHTSWLCQVSRLLHLCKPTK